MVGPVRPQEGWEPIGDSVRLSEARQALRALSISALEELDLRIRSETSRLIHAGEPAPNAQRVTLAALRVFPQPRGLRVCTAAIGRWMAAALHRLQQAFEQFHYPVGRCSLAELDAVQLQAISRLTSQEAENMVLRERTRQLFLHELADWVESAPSQERVFHAGERAQLADRLARLAEHSDFPENVTHLSNGVISGSFADLPGALGRLSSLEDLTIENCPNLQRLPAEWAGLSNLQALVVESCPQFEGLDSLAPRFGELSRLSYLSIRNCPSVHTLPDNLYDLPALQTISLNFEGVPQARLAFPEDLGRCAELEEIRVLGRAEIEIPASIGQLRQLFELDLGEARVNALPPEILELPESCRITLPADFPELASFQERSQQPDYQGPRIQVNEFFPVPGEDRGLAFQQQLRADMNALAQQMRGLLAAAAMNLQPAAPVLAVNRNQLIQNPRAVLLQVAKQLTTHPNQSLQITFTGEAGIDAGGLRKSLWTDLSKSLFQSERSSSHLLGERSGVTAEKPEGDGWVPLLENDQDREALHDLGSMMAYGANQLPPMLMAKVFSPVLFDALRLRIQGRPDFEVVAKLLHQPYCDLLLQDPATWNAEHVRLVSDTGEALGFDPLPAGAADRPAWIEELKASIVEGNSSKLSMLDALIEGFEAGAPGIAWQLAGLSEVPFRESFQGRLDPEAFIKALTCHDQSRLMALPNPSRADRERLLELNMRMDWFKGWIRHPLEPDQGPQDPVEREQAEQKLRRDLLNAITGRESLLDGEEVYLALVGPDQAPSLHTCFNRLDMPVSIDSQQEFRTELRSLSRASGYSAA